MRIIAFVGSPVEDNEKDVSLKSCITFWSSPTERNFIFLPMYRKFNTLTCQPYVSLLVSSCSHPNLLILQLVKMAKRLKKEKVNVDIINFGEEVRNSWFIFMLLQSKWKYDIDFHIWHFFPFINWVFNWPCHLSPTVLFRRWTQRSWLLL